MDTNKHSVYCSYISSIEEHLGYEIGARTKLHLPEASHKVLDLLKHICFVWLKNLDKYYVLNPHELIEIYNKEAKNIKTYANKKDNQIHNSIDVEKIYVDLVMQFVKHRDEVLPYLSSH